MSDYEMVRVATAMVAKLIAEPSAPVVVVGLERYDDGTIDLIFQTPSVEQLTAALGQGAQKP
jgi:hypothetical protein